ncbi:shikimate dehydrogenase [Listeria ilorinensis]|uniref:shikimate dehydrogenase n=1 Tax=Listeria ilorinensis TaxID=2867439 RepID=UPI001EF5DF83|nr:shikimate dehydrogenase [Listeria ilorinensis]
MKQYAVIGNPIRHSLSPVMHNRVIEALGLDAHYRRVYVDEAHFDAEIKALKATGVSGFNITTPFKERIISHLDEIHGLAKDCRAVNTAVLKGGKWHGYNTDGQGYFEGLEEIRPLQKSDRILLIGAGGASKGIYLTIKQQVGCPIDLTNRTISRAQEMLISAEDRAISLQAAEEQLAKYAIIIQTTSIGLPNSSQDVPLSLSNLTAGTIVSDIIYNPYETTFLKQAKQKGAITQNGLPMFVGQGALAFTHWTNIEPDRRLMKEAVLEALDLK